MTKLGSIFSGLLPLLRPKAHCVINVPDYWMENKRYTLHINVVNALREIGFELRNTIIWDKTNIVNAIGIFGYPSNYITMGTTFEYLLDFWKPVIYWHYDQFNFKHANQFYVLIWFAQKTILRNILSDIFKPIKSKRQ